MSTQLTRCTALTHASRAGGSVEVERTEAAPSVCAGHVLRGRRGCGRGTTHLGLTGGAIRVTGVVDVHSASTQLACREGTKKPLLVYSREGGGNTRVLDRCTAQVGLA